MQPQSDNSENKFIYSGTPTVLRSAGLKAEPLFSTVVTVHVIPFTSDNKVVAINVRSRGIDIPGGHVDPGETTPFETLYRELKEEAQITIYTPVLVDVLEVLSPEALGDPRKKYLLIYAARVDRMDVFTSSDEVSERLILDQKEFVTAYFGTSKAVEQLVQLGASKVE